MPRSAVLSRAAAGLRIDQALAQAFPDYSRSRLQSWLRDGRVRVDDAPCTDPGRKVWGGERVEFEPDDAPASSAAAPEAIGLDFAYEDDAILVVRKPAGLVVHPGSGNWTGTLQNALLHHDPALAGLPRAGLVHRLDKDTSGLMVVARTLIAQTHLVRQLAVRSVKREYLAIVNGEVAAGGTIEAPIGRDPKVRTRMAVVASGRAARTRYKVLERAAGATLLECSLDTGRTHQIRVHLRSIGHPLVGDPVYGKRAVRALGAAAAVFGRQALHATRLALDHPVTGERREWTMPMPEDMAALWRALAAR